MAAAPDQSGNAPPPQGALRKDISLFGVFALSVGTTISSGLFLLPGLAFAQAGPAILVSYLIAGIAFLPPCLCKSELATAMPRAGGVYFYIDRAFGPLAGAIAGLSTWISLTLKTSFALVGSGYYIGLFLPDPPVLLIAVGLAVAFGLLNIFGAGKAAKLQAGLVVGVLILLLWFILTGTVDIDTSRFSGFWDAGGDTVASMIGVVFVSYMGLTKVASVAEEVRNPERNLPLGILLGLSTAVIVYICGIAVMIGTLPADQLATTYTPAADAAEVFAGRTGLIVISIAAIASFLSVANAGILSASRYPLAMGRDHLLPRLFRSLSRFGTPVPAILATVALIVLQVVLLDPLAIAKYASTVKLMLFIGVCCAVLTMRESRLASYDPGFRVPFYPWIPLIGIASCITLMVLLGWAKVLFAVALVVVSIIWFRWYAAARVRRFGAIHHVFARLGEHRFDPLDTELRGIIKEKGLRAADPFDETISVAQIVEVGGGRTFGEVAAEVADLLAAETNRSASHFVTGFMEGTRVGATPVTSGVALPHLRLEGLDRSYLVLARAVHGMTIEIGEAIPGEHHSERVYALFFMASPERDPALHLRLLANLAGAVEAEGFMDHWLAAKGPADLKEALLRSEFSLTITITPEAHWAGRALSTLNLPDGVLVALIYRGHQRVIPDGTTTLEVGDRMILLGEPDAIGTLRDMLGIET